MSAVTEQPKFTQPIEADLAQLEQTMIGELSAYNEDLIACLCGAYANPDF